MGDAPHIPNYKGQLHTPPTDPETGKALKSFYFGGEWEEIDLPSNEELITAWMFLLADCEVIDSEIEPQQKQKLLERANHLLWQGYFKETEEEQTHEYAFPKCFGVSHETAMLSG